MQILKSLFRRRKQITWEGPEIQFGRFNDSEKSPEKYKQWDLSMEAFDAEKFHNCYKYFLEFLKDDAQENVTYSTKQGVITFNIIQGSKIIRGIADHHTFSAETRLVKSENPSLPMMRYLLEANYELRYNKYALDENNNVALVFDTMVEDSSPHKLYQALKELATEADRKDDYLINKFPGLKPMDVDQLQHISDTEKTIKFDFFKTKIEDAIKIIEEGDLSNVEFPGAATFVILDTIYAIDFLIKPEGRAKEIIASIHEKYFEDTSSTLFEKNKWMIQELKKLANISKEDLSKELYEIKSTFGTPKSDNFDMFHSVIAAQKSDLMWYYENHPQPYTQAISGYIVGYAMYAYALPSLVKEILMMYYRVVYHSFFASLGFRPDLAISQETGEVFKNRLLELFQTLETKETMSERKLFAKSIDFRDIAAFSKTYIECLGAFFLPKS